MAKTVQYWGTVNYQELPLTGRLVTWTPKQKQEVPDAIATLLLAAGVGFLLDNDNNGELAVYATDSGGNVTGLVGPSGSVIGIAPLAPQVKPWSIATYGDSRVNTGSTGPDLAGSQLNTNVRVPMWAAAYMGDAEITRNYGVSGDTVVGWNVAARTGGKTFADFDKSTVDAVLVQYGVNDAMALTSAVTITAALQALCTEILKSGKYLIFESINPVGSLATNYVAAQITIDTVNASMRTWIAQFPLYAVYADTAFILKDSTGYANATYYNADTIHLIFNGAQAAGKIIAAAARTLMPKRNGLFFAPDNSQPNLLNLVSPSAFSAVETGAATIPAATSGQDSNGYYVEWTVTPTSLTTGECRARLDLSANFSTASVPYYALNGNEVIQGSARVIFDDGAGNAPAAYSIAMRQRFYTGAVFRDAGIIPQAPATGWNNLITKVDAQFITPRVANAAASVSAVPADAAGYQLQIYIEMQQTGTPVRVRLYNPQLRVVGYTTTSLTASSFTIPATGVAYTNASNGKQQVVVGGGTVTILALNGTTTGLTNGVFILNPGDTLTPTYSVAPTWTVNQIN